MGILSFLLCDPGSFIAVQNQFVVRQNLSIFPEYFFSVLLLKVRNLAMNLVQPALSAKKFLFII